MLIPLVFFPLKQQSTSREFQKRADREGGAKATVSDKCRRHICVSNCSALRMPADFQMFLNSLGYCN